jgi:triacylglycerol lipase
MRILIFLLTLLSILATTPCRGEILPREKQPECVILLHGLIRTSASMSTIASALREEGFTVVNQDYPSRKYSIEELSAIAIDNGLAACRMAGAQRVHFVTHSLGGILVRYYLSEKTITGLGRTVMLAPPNQGSSLVDLMKYFPELEDIAGPAGYQLGTTEDSVPASLGPANFEVGVIAGDHTVNPVMSEYLEKPNDGKVTVESTRLEGMTDFLVVPQSHPFIMTNQSVIGQIIYFLYFGEFARSEP